MSEFLDRILLWVLCVVLTVALFLRELPDRARSLFIFIESIATRSIADFSKVRKAVAVVLLFLVPIFIGIGFGVQAVDVIGDSTTAMLWFSMSAILAAILVFIWEEIAAISAWHRVFVMVLLEIFILSTFYHGVVWAADKALNASNLAIREISERSKEDTMYSLWLKSLQNPQVVLDQSKPIANEKITRSAVQAKPDIAMALIYPEEFELLF